MEFAEGVEVSVDRVIAISPESFGERRGVGKKNLPASVGGLLVHCADHTQRHVGQLVTTAKVVVGMRQGEHRPDEWGWMRKATAGPSTPTRKMDRDAARLARLGSRRPHVEGVSARQSVPGVRVAYTDEREIQHAMDLGALVIVIPTVRSVEEGTAARDWTMFPPLGKRSQGGGQAFDPDVWGSVPAGIATPSTTTSC